MRTKNSIVNDIFKGIYFSQKEIDFIQSKIKKVIITKGEFLITPNTYVNSQYYVANGCLRSYFVDTSGKEHTIQFAIEDWWISDYTSLFTSEKSIMSVECLQDAVIYQFSRENFEELCLLYPKIEMFVRQKLEKAYASFQKRILHNFSKPAKERYLLFITRYPNIEKSVKNYHIASYLGITTESLSRIRKTTN